MRTFLFTFLCFASVVYASSQPTKRGVTIENNTPQDSMTTIGTTYAVIVGVSAYKYIKPLNYADKDALLFKDFLQSKAGGSVKDENILKLINEEAKLSIAGRISMWLNSKKLQKGDRVFFYFAGHGDAIDKYKYFFLLEDCNVQDKSLYQDGGALRMSDVKEDIAELFDKYDKQIDVILIWDACRTNELGGATGNQALIDGITEKSSGELIMLSASAGESALEDYSYAQGHGLFTYYLIDGLSGAADKNRDGIVSVRELDRWVSDKVSDDAANKFNKHDQNPRFIYNTDEPIAKVDSSFQEEWAWEKTHDKNAIAYQKTKRSVEDNERDTVLIGLYNQCMTAIKQDNIETAETLLTNMKQKYGNSSLTDEAEFNLAMEYIDISQDKINFYLNNDDNGGSLAAADKHGAAIETRFRKTQQINYATYAGYLQKAITVLMKSESNKTDYINQLKAKQYYFLSQGLISNYGHTVIDVDKALQYAYQSLLLNPNSAFSCKVLSTLYSFKDANLDSAKYFARKAMQLAPQWAVGLNGLGVLFDEERQYDSALIYYRKALSINPNYCDAINNIGVVYTNGLHQYDSALFYFKKAVAINSTYDLSLANIGVIFDKLRQYDSARYYFQQAISINPKYDSHYNWLGDVYNDLKQYDSAKYFYNKAISINPKYETAYNNLGIMFDDLRQYDSAKYYYHQVIAVNPKAEYAYNNLGNVFNNDLHQYDSAKYYYNKAILINPKAEYAYNSLGNVFNNDLHQYDSAKYYYNRAISVNPKYENAYNNLGIVSSNLHQYDSAKYYYHQAISINPKYENAYNNLGIAFENLKQYDSAKYYYRQAVSANPKNEKAYDNLGDVYGILDILDSAKYFYRQAIVLNPTDAYAYRSLGNFIWVNNDTIMSSDSAKYYFRQAISFDPLDNRAYDNLGSLYDENLKQYDSARYYHRRAIELDSTSAGGYYNLGVDFFKEKILDSAKHYFIKASKLYPDYNNAIQAIISIGYEYIDSLDNYPKAFECFDYIKNIRPSEGYYHLTCWDTRQHKVDEALTDFEQALKNGYNDYKHIAEDADLTLIRNTDRFKALMKQYFSEQYKE